MLFEMVWTHTQIKPGLLYERPTVEPVEDRYTHNSESKSHNPRSVSLSDYEESSSRRELEDIQSLVQVPAANAAVDG